MKRSLVVATLVAACVAGLARAALPPDPRAAEAVGELRVLVIRAPTRPRVRAIDHAWLSWARSSDAGSGVAGYRVSIDGKLLATTAVTGTALPALRPGGHRVTVVAVDRAGNRSRPAVVSLHV